MEFNYSLLLYSLYKNIFYDSCLGSKVIFTEPRFTVEEYGVIAPKVADVLETTYNNITEFGKWKSDFNLKEKCINPIDDAMVSAYKGVVERQINLLVKSSKEDTIKESFRGAGLGYMKSFEYINGDIEKCVEDYLPIASALVAFLNDIHIDIHESINFRLFMIFNLIELKLNPIIETSKIIDKKIIYDNVIRNIKNLIICSFEDMVTKIEEILKISEERNLEETILDIKKDYLKFVIRISLTTYDESEITKLNNIVDLYNETKSN